MIDTRCGLQCEDCEFKESHNCGGCIATQGNPFHGECPVAACCQEKGLVHCGECDVFPCELLKQYSCDPENGDTPHGARIEKCREWAKLASKEIRTKAASLLESCNELSVASITESGYPRICVVSKLKNESFHTVYYSTGTYSEKTKHYVKSPKSSVCYYNNGNSVTLIGNNEIIEDMEVKKELWQDWMINHFSKGAEDPDYCVLKFTAKTATLWIDGQFVTIVV